MTTDGPKNACNAKMCEICAARARREKEARDELHEADKIRVERWSAKRVSE